MNSSWDEGWDRDQTIQLNILYFQISYIQKLEFRRLNQLIELNHFLWQVSIHSYNRAIFR